MKVNCSSIAKLVGFHPYGDLPMSIVDLVYQDRDSMRRRDSKRWNIVWVSEEETVNALLSKASKDVRTHMKEKIGKERNLKEVRQSESKFSDIIKKSSVFTEQERDLLVAKARHEMFTNFGNRFESNALKVYEKKTGREIRDSNSTKYFWAFPLDCNKLRAPNLLKNGDGDQGWIESVNNGKSEDEIRGVIEGFSKKMYQNSNKLYRNCLIGNDWLRFPCYLGKRERFLVHRTAEQFGLLHESEGIEGTNRTVTIRRAEHVQLDRISIEIACCVRDMINTLLPKDKENCKKQNVVDDAALILTGMVDGIAEEIYFAEEEEEEEEEDVTIQEDSMKLRNIVIEIKHRMVKSANRVPPLYDQIQCVAYVESKIIV